MEIKNEMASSQHPEPDTGKSEHVDPDVQIITNWAEIEPLVEECKEEFKDTLARLADA